LTVYDTILYAPFIRFLGLLKYIYHRFRVAALTFKNLPVTLRTTRFNIKKFYIVIIWNCVFCIDFGTNSKFCLTEHKIICVYN
jgi:hypothetical protein